MRTRRITLTDHEDDFLEQLVKTSKYQNASEAICHSLRILRQKLRQDEFTAKALRSRPLAAGLALERSNSATMVGVNVENFVKELTGAQKQRLFTILRSLAISSWDSHGLTAAWGFWPNGGVLTGASATQRALQRPTRYASSHLRSMPSTKWPQRRTK